MDFGFGCCCNKALQKLLSLISITHKMYDIKSHKMRFLIICEALLTPSMHTLFCNTAGPG